MLNEHLISFPAVSCSRQQWISYQLSTGETWFIGIAVYNNNTKCGNMLNDVIHSNKGPKEGGLLSPFLFNLLYQDTMED